MGKHENLLAFDNFLQSQEVPMQVMAGTTFITRWFGKRANFFSVQGCKQADRPLDGQIAGYKMVMTNVKKKEPVFYGQSMRTEVSFTISPGVTAIEQHFTGALGDLYVESMKHCKKHLQENSPE